MDARARTWTAVERAARDAYGRSVAALSYRFRDIAAAEDAMSDALREALERWPISGIPNSPAAWLMTVAKNNLRQRARHSTMASGPETLAAVEETLAALEEQRGPAIDARLNLMFVCAHPAIDETIRTPLMLQTVLGLDALRIGAAFVVPGPTMGQRLVRAKQKIRDAAVPFDPPEGRELGERVGAVLEGIYAAFGIAWEDRSSDLRPANELIEPLVDEAIFLARLLVELLPQEPEALGLLALMLLSHARREARFDSEGAFVPLAQQDTTRWDREAIVEAEGHLFRAASIRRPGPFQWEAAIQSAHCQRIFSGITPWTAIVALYEALNHAAPNLATRVAHVAALVEVGRIERAVASLEAIDRDRVAAYQPYWVVAARVARATGDRDGHRDAMQRAISLTTDAALRAHLELQLRDLSLK